MFQKVSLQHICLPFKGQALFPSSCLCGAQTTDGRRIMWLHLQQATMAFRLLNLRYRTRGSCCFAPTGVKETL